MPTKSSFPVRSLFDRRALLQAMGLGAGSLFLPSLATEVRAAAPKRLYIYYTQHGPFYPNWAIRQPGLDDRNTDWEIDLTKLPEASWSEVLRPLYGVKEDLIVVDGTANVVGLNQPNANAHDAGNNISLTGANMGAGGGQGPSIDQIVGKAVAVAGRRQSLYASTWGAWSPVHSGPGRQINGIVEPQQLFDSIIGLATPTTTTPGTKPPVDKLAAARATSLPDLIREDYKALAGKLSGEDKNKVQEHIALMDSLQKQLQTTVGLGDTPMPTCTLGAAPGGFSEHLKSAGAAAKILSGALACDITRVAVQVVSQLGASEFGAPAVKDVHQDIAHDALPGHPAATYMTQYYNRHAQQFATIVSQLKTLGILQDTVVAWVSELASGPHDMNRLPVVLAGSCGGYFKTGRYLKYAETGMTAGVKVGPAHNKTLVSLMNAMGLPDTSIGVTTSGGINVAGALPRLRPTG